MVTLKQLRHMQAVMRHGSLQEAAQHLHITAPALSRSLVTLEEKLQLRLFDRGKGGMQPTRFCLMVEERCTQLLLQAEELEREARLYRELVSGQLCIGVGKAIREWALQSALPTFFKENPSLRIRVKEGSVNELVEGLRNRELDLVLAGFESYQDRDGLSISFITDIDTPVWVRTGHPLTNQEPVTPDRLVDYPMLAATTMAPTHPFLSKLKERFGVSLGQQVLCSDYPTLTRMLLASDAWLAAPLPSFQSLLESEVLHRLTVTGWDLSVRLSLIELRERSREPAADRFHQLCQSLLA